MSRGFCHDFTFDNLIDSEAYADHEEPIDINPQQNQVSRLTNHGDFISNRCAQLRPLSPTISTSLAQKISLLSSTLPTTAESDVSESDVCPPDDLKGNSESSRWERPRSVSPWRWKGFSPNHQRALVHAHRINGADGEPARHPCTQCVRFGSRCRVYTAPAKARHWVRGGESCSLCYEKHRQCSFINRSSRDTGRRLGGVHRRPESDGLWFSVSRESWETWSREGRNGRERLRRYAQVGRMEEVQGEGEAAVVPCDRCVTKGYRCRLFTAEAQRKYCQKSARICSRCTFSMTLSCNASGVRKTPGAS